MRDKTKTTQSAIQKVDGICKPSKRFERNFLLIA
jgi:hypothetical protein